MLETLGEHQVDSGGRGVGEGASEVLASASVRVALMPATLRSMVRTSTTRMVSRAATATTTTSPAQLAICQSVSWFSVRAKIMVNLPTSAGRRFKPSMTLTAMVLVVARSARAARVHHRLLEAVVDQLGLVADPPGQNQDRHDEGDAPPGPRRSR